MIYEFDRCVLDVDRQELWRDGELVHVEPQVLAVLEHLAANAERIVTKIELLDEVWGDRFVSESALTSRIKLARKAVGDSGREQRVVKTVHSRGFRMAVDVRVVDGPTPRPDPGVATGPPATVSATTAAAVPPAPSTSVVGREAELARLEAALAEAATGRRATVVVRGGLGMGKSTLVAELLERQESLDGWLVARGRCIQVRSGVEPYFGLLDALSHLARSEPAVVHDVLDRVAPSWLAQLPALVAPEEREALERRLLGASAPRMLREGVEALEALARHRPLVLLLEDLQWADDCTRDVLDLLVGRPDPAPLLLLATERDEDGGALAPAGGRVEVVSLGPLDVDAVAALALDRLDGARADDELVGVLADRSGGVPLFAEEILASWRRRGDLVVADGSATATRDLGELAAAVPDALPPLVERELADLDPDALAVLEACGVAGDAFDAATVAAGLGRTVADVEGVLTGLARRRGLIGATGAGAWPDGTISASYAFTHRLYRQVVEDRIPASQRALLHARVGQGLEAGWGARAEEQAVALADHFAQAGDALRAVHYLRAAGEQASARSAHGHAVDFLSDALARVVALPPSPERDRAELDVRTALGPALVATRGWFDEAVATDYERALELCSGRPGCPEAAAARYGLATVSELRGQFERTEALLTPLLDAEAEGHLALEAHELVACSTFHQGAFERSLDNASMVLDEWDEDAYSVLMARIAEHPASSCSSWSSLALWGLGRTDDSLRLAERAVALAERNRYALSTAVQQRAMLHQVRGEPEATITWAERCRQVGEEQDFPMRTIQADIYKGWALGVSGDTEEGTRLLADGIARFRAAGATLNEAYYLGLHADALLHGGEPDLALGLLDEALATMTATTRSYFFEPELHRLRARALLDAAGEGAAASARAALDEAAGAAERQGSPTLRLRAAADRLALEAGNGGDPAPWAEAVTDLLATFDGQQPTPDVERARALLSG